MKSCHLQQKRIELGDILFNEISQTQKDKFCLFSLQVKLKKKVDFIEVEHRRVLTRG
jgi:hypothetical protein